MGYRVRCAWCDLDLTFNLVVETLVCKILSRVGILVRGVDVHRHGVTFNLGSAEVC